MKQKLIQWLHNALTYLKSAPSRFLNWARTRTLRQWIIIFLRTVVVLVLLLLLFVGSVYVGLWGHIPTAEELKHIENDNASELLDCKGNLLSRYFLRNRISVDSADISPNVYKALVATEDSRFFEHSGVDAKSMARVFFKSVLMMDSRQGGGSTISQQLAKNVFERRNLGIFTVPVAKIKEIVIAQRLEEVYSKDQILLLYLNTVPFGENVYGIEAAAKRFFSRRAKWLDLPTSATLVGMLAANTKYNPRINPERSVERRNLVIDRMCSAGYIDSVEAQKAKAQDLVLKYNTNDRDNGTAVFFRDIVGKQAQTILNEIYGEGTYDIYTDGLIIRSTVDATLQRLAERSVVAHMTDVQKAFNDEWKSDSLATLSAGFLAANPHNGHVLAWVGGVDHNYSQIEHVTMNRQVGSTFKPFVYATALENGIPATTYVENVRRSYGKWSPGNSDGKYGGFYSLKGALSRSLNTVSAWIIDKVGPAAVIEECHNMGIESSIPVVPSIALGTAELTLYEMTQAYIPFATGGIAHQLTCLLSIETRDGHVLFKADPDTEGIEVLAHDNAVLVRDMLTAVVDSGTGRSIRRVYGIKSPFAGKTGTTQNGADGWFMGMTPNMVMGAWVGADDPSYHFKSSARGQGAYMALPIVGKFVSGVAGTKLADQFVYGQFPQSEDFETTVTMLYPHNMPYDPNPDSLRMEVITAAVWKGLIEPSDYSGDYDEDSDPFNFSMDKKDKSERPIRRGFRNFFRAMKDIFHNE
ncbi:MAG: transglycosylase domain-containing protein [Bacteroidales bacterium]|nr:transglycosylase domain-containing protein [Bacteroidales bacterium]